MYNSLQISQRLELNKKLVLPNYALANAIICLLAVYIDGPDGRHFNTFDTRRRAAEALGWSWRAGEAYADEMQNGTSRARRMWRRQRKGGRRDWGHEGFAAFRSWLVVSNGVCLVTGRRDLELSVDR